MADQEATSVHKYKYRTVATVAKLHNGLTNLVFLLLTPPNINQTVQEELQK